MFEPVTEELICRLISQSPTKSCTLDPIPTTLTKQCLVWPSPPCHKDCQCFFVHRHCPVWVKAGSCDTHTEKDPGLDANDLRNFRPVSNLPFVSKILERAVLLQLQSHLSTKISQYRNFCFECTRRPPYKVWSETCVSTCTVGFECCFWHPWPCHPIKTTWEHFWNLGISAVLVRVIPKW